MRRSAEQAEQFECPIPGCKHLFEGMTGVFAHVVTLGRHPKWHPEVRDPSKRYALLKSEFPAFFLHAKMLQPRPRRRPVEAARTSTIPPDSQVRDVPTEQGPYISIPCPTCGTPLRACRVE